MRKLSLIAGLPRAGSTLLCQIINSNPSFHVTPTSGIIDTVRNIRSTFSHNPSWKAQDRIKLMSNIRNSMKGFLEGFFYDKEVVFDKCRGWSNNIGILDEILQHKNTKIIWTYRDPVEIVGSIEAQYQKTILLENADESSAPGAFATLDRRIGTFINNDSIISYPVEILRDAIEMGFGNRILFIRYFDLTNNTQATMDAIHEFIGEEKYTYDLKNIKQTTFEWDGTYNYKFLHTIKEGEIKWKKSDVNLHPKYINIINEKYQALNKIMFTGDGSDLLGVEAGSIKLNVFNLNNTLQNQNTQKGNPFDIGG
jgi:sulfotransferase